jgi:hypothetical protein
MSAQIISRELPLNCNASTGKAAVAAKEIGDFTTLAAGEGRARIGFTSGEVIQYALGVYDENGILIEKVTPREFQDALHHAARH